MWRFALVLVVVVGCCHACPEYCECHQLPDPEDLAALLEATCLGNVPRLVDLSSTTRRLRIIGANESEILGLLEELANGTAPLPYLDEFHFTNCSLRSLNSSAWFAGLERARTLNISRNNLSDLEDMRRTAAGGQVNMSNLVVLDASNNLVSNLSADTFGTLPILVRLCLKGNSIGSVNARAFAGLGLLEELDLSDNELTSIPETALTPLESLEKLDLSGNQLEVLGAGWFESLGRLRELDVSRNGLSRAASGALQPLPGLSVLRLAGNPLRERDVSLLLGTGRKLETVDASRTGLIRVPAALTRSVRALRLAGNRLTSIRGGDLDSYPLLRLLDMSDNRLTDVEEDALGRLEALEVLDLSGNFLTKVPRSLPGSLSFLNLERNRIDTLRFNDLQGLYNVRELSLGKNSIVDIQEGAFGQLIALEVLDVSDNPMNQLPANTLNGPTHLGTLRMSGLTALKWDRRDQGDMTFPVPAPERLVDLDVSRSPVLAAQLLADTAALSACKSLLRLDLESTNLTSIRSDLVYFVPQLRVLGLGGNPWNCTDEIYWLGEWLRNHEEREPLSKCTRGIHVRDLPPPPTPEATSSRSVATPQEKSKVGTSSRPPTTGDVNIATELFLRWETEGENTTLVEESTSVKVARSSSSSAPARLSASAILFNVSHRLAPSRNRAPSTPRPTNTLEIIVEELSANGTSTTNATRYEDEDEDVEMGVEKEEEEEEEPRKSGREANTVAEELSGRATDSGARVAEGLSAGAHPGMLILVGAALGAVAAFSVVLSRRATARRRDCCYQRQENIEVHTLTPVTELW
ncbi:insulin-like growth factor-binding protein complex acid labile subunit [Diprion similis]|uniref:insulin-like growth factor-binding protein complex acid labile subunit n=1 Tax=Diprion similis TaxID=362088 RepID=UPI001EF806DC|nr:insulin-like growth factor-binding protein complex acid labile subunit [Diprion similis]